MHASIFHALYNVMDNFKSYQTGKRKIGPAADSNMDSLIYFCYKLRVGTVSGLVGHFETSEIHQLTGSGGKHEHRRQVDRTESKKHDVGTHFVHSPHETCK